MLCIVFLTTENSVKILFHYLVSLSMTLILLIVLTRKQCGGQLFGMEYQYPGKLIRISVVSRTCHLCTINYFIPSNQPTSPHNDRSVILGQEILQAVRRV